MKLLTTILTPTDLVTVSQYRKRPYISPQVSFEEEELEEKLLQSSGGTENPEGEGSDEQFGSSKQSTFVFGTDYDYQIPE